jgi:fructose-1,6-bisphosphatase/inositol monophosphatase family enzyme
MTDLPPPIAAGPWASRLRAAVRAADSAAAALLRVRGAPLRAREAAGGQLKTGVDEAAEGWVLGLLRGDFPDDVFLSEEAFEVSGGGWSPPSAFWTVDALDGTRSFAGGYDGFCVQLAYVVEGVVRLGVVHEPVAGTVYLAARGGGAYRGRGGAFERLSAQPVSRRSEATVFVDSTVPAGPAGEVFRGMGGRFLECGSVGLKVCRVAEGAADVFLKAFTFKLWDVAPGEVILAEAGGRLGLWSGDPVRYDTPRVRWTGLLAARRELFDEMARAVGTMAGTGAADAPGASEPASPADSS